MNPNQNGPNNPPPAGGQPDLGSAPTFTPPSAEPPPIQSEPPTPMSSLDNPLQAPPQPPAIDSGFTWPNPQPSQPNTPSVTPQDLYGPSPASPPPPPPSIVPPITPNPQEAAPTDLSHLVANNDQPVYTPPVTQPETLVTPPNGGEEVPNVPIENHNGGMPKWVIGLGLGILLAVIGASGYFILGIGRQTENGSTSLPATTNKKQTITPPPSPIASPSPATTSATFGGVSGTSPATSAADLLKQRQSR